MLKAILYIYNHSPSLYMMNRIGDIMMSVFVSSVINGGLEHGRVNSTTVKLVFAAFPLSTQL